MKTHLPMGPGVEFDAVRALLKQWGSAAQGVGDDAAVLDVPVGSRLVVSTDSSVENVHFRRDWLSPAEIGWRATQAALSDLAAMAAAPLGVLLALTVPEGWRADLSQIAEGIADATRGAGAPIVGGDVSDGDRLTLAITVLGHAVKPLTRAGARPGDVLYVTGALGGPGAALAKWGAGLEPSAPHRARFARPHARIAAGLWAAAHGATAGIDLSDGLAGDAAHLAAASGVRCVLALEKIPCVEGVTAEDALASGEEYELLVAAHAFDVAAFTAAHGGLALTAVGRVEALPGLRERASEGVGGGGVGDVGEVRAERDGKPVKLTVPTHDHFAS